MHSAHERAEKQAQILDALGSNSPQAPASEGADAGLLTGRRKVTDYGRRGGPSSNPWE
jgi:hypothetical protein